MNFRRTLEQYSTGKRGFSQIGKRTTRMANENSSKTNPTGRCQCCYHIQCQRTQTRTRPGKSIGYGKFCRSLIVSKKLKFQPFVFDLKTLKRFNTLLTTNGLLRSEIDNLRIERQRYEDIFQKAEKELKSLRDQLVRSIESSLKANEQR